PGGGQRGHEDGVGPERVGREYGGQVEEADDSWYEGGEDSEEVGREYVGQVAAEDDSWYAEDDSAGGEQESVDEAESALEGEDEDSYAEAEEVYESDFDFLGDTAGARIRAKISQQEAQERDVASRRQQRIRQVASVVILLIAAVAAYLWQTWKPPVTDTSETVVATSSTSATAATQVSTGKVLPPMASPTTLKGKVQRGLNHGYPFYAPHTAGSRAGKGS
ncbi:hypothetical protein ACFL59_04715, partial [Planctomycetota bacterium]